MRRKGSEKQLNEPSASAFRDILIKEFPQLENELNDLYEEVRKKEFESILEKWHGLKVAIESLSETTLDYKNRADSKQIEGKDELAEITKLLDYAKRVEEALKNFEGDLTYAD